MERKKVKDIINQNKIRGLLFVLKSLKKKMYSIQIFATNKQKINKLKLKD